MEWKNAGTVVIGADLVPAMMKESEGVRFCPVFKITCDGNPVDYAFHTRLRWERRALNGAHMAARIAMAGKPLDGERSGSWPFLDLSLEKGNGEPGEAILLISDQNMLLHRYALKPSFWEAVYKVKGAGLKSSEIRCIGRDSWQTRTAGAEGPSGSTDGAIYRAGFVGTCINLVQFLLPPAVRKSMAFDISDFLPLKYDFRYQGRVVATIAGDIKPVFKTLSITFAENIDEGGRLSAMAHAAVLLFFISRKIAAPEDATALGKSMRRST